MSEDLDVVAASAMLITPASCRLDVIQPALWAIGKWSLIAEDIVLGTALVESGLRSRRQVGGPALGLWQMEPATHDDIWGAYLRYRPELAAKMRNLIENGDDAAAHIPPPAVLERNDRYACAMARIKYLRASEQLPSVRGDIEAYGRFWKVIYNTDKGKGTVAAFVAAWRAHAAAAADEPAAPTAAAMPAPAISASRPRRVIAIVNPIDIVDDAEAAALRDAAEIYINEHVAPAWGMAGADLVFVEDKTAIPPANFELVALVDKSDQAGALAYHYDVRASGVPIAKSFVGTCRDYGESWQQASLHEIGEMFVDPDCDSIAPVFLPDGRYVDTMREICDPVQEQGYRIGDVEAPNFVFPAYYKTGLLARSGVKLDYLGNLKTPMELPRGGYYSIRDHQSGVVWQQIFGAHVPLHKRRAVPGSRRERIHAGPHRLRVAPQ